MSDMLLKLLSRLTFLALLIIIIPLAVQNRQLISVELNPLALVNDALSVGFTLPLFVLLIVTLFIGLGAGLLFGWGMARLQLRKKAGKLKRAVPPGPMQAPMTDTAPSSVAASTQAPAKMLEAEPQADSARARAAMQASDDDTDDDADDTKAEKNVG